MIVEVLLIFILIGVMTFRLLEPEKNWWELGLYLSLMLLSVFLMPALYAIVARPDDRLEV